MSIKTWMSAAAMLAMTAFGASAQEVSAQRLKDILTMTPEQMAATGAWTRSNYDRLVAYVNGIKDPKIRAIVRDMVVDPKSQVFNASAQKNAFRFAPAAGGPGHHFYPGGLAVHAVENIEVSIAWGEAIGRVHGAENFNRDIIVAALTLHDWAKVWYEWDDVTGEIKRPAWFPAYWGGDQGVAKWKWMGGHGAIVYSELMKRGAPADLTIATAAAHFDPFWDVEKVNGAEGLNAALAEAAKLAQVPAIKVDPAKRMGEWWMVVYSDGSWSYSHYIAGQFSHNWIREVAKDLGFEPKSPQANRLASFVLTRISDFKLYNMYQNAGYNADVVKKVIRGILADSAAYEVPAG